MSQDGDKEFNLPVVSGCVTPWDRDSYLGSISSMGKIIKYHVVTKLTKTIFRCGFNFLEFCKYMQTALFNVNLEPCLCIAFILLEHSIWYKYMCAHLKVQLVLSLDTAISRGIA